MFSILEKGLYHTKRGQKLIGFLKSIQLTSYGLSMYTFLFILYHKLNDDEIIHRAQAVSYSFVIAIIPSIIFSLTLIAYMPMDKLGDQIDQLFTEMTPEYIMSYVHAWIIPILKQQNVELLSIGFLLTVYMATSGMRTLMDAFNSIYHTKDKRSYFEQLIVAVILTIMFVFTLLSASVFLVMGKSLLKYVMEVADIDSGYLFYLINTLRFVIMTLIFAFNISFIYYWAPAIQKRWKFFSPGALIATILAITTSIIFSYYIDHFNTYNRLYGSLGALMGVMVWIFALAFILLVGFEINSILANAKEKVGINKHS